MKFKNKFRILILIICLPLMFSISGGCDTDNDSDRDDVEDFMDDNCPNTFNPLQEDTDGDGFGDACDNCPDFQNTSIDDNDQDGIGNECDNCPDTFNDIQIDADGDGLGNVCDNCVDIANPDQIDSDNNGIGDVCEDESLIVNGSATFRATETITSTDCPNTMIGDMSGGESLFTFNNNSLTVTDPGREFKGSITSSKDGDQIIYSLEYSGEFVVGNATVKSTVTAGSENDINNFIGTSVTEIDFESDGIIDCVITADLVLELVDGELVVEEI